MWIARSGTQWRLLPRSYGEWSSVFKRFDRWAEKGVWQAMMEHFAGDADRESVLIDATVVRAHSSAALKGGIRRKKLLGVAREASPPKSTLPPMPLATL